MKLIGICSIGTFHSPWFSYAIASIYNTCDQIVVSNVGYNIHDPDGLVPLDSVSLEIKRLDIRHKIIELNHIQPNALYTKMDLMTQRDGNKNKSGRWFDVRGLGLTAANEYAVKLDADWILKIDSDQACYADIYKLKHFLHVFPANGLKFRQYEFCDDVGNNTHYVTNPPPSPYEDSVFVYKAMHGQFYAGGGSPSLLLPGEDRLNTDVFHAAHLRSANPMWLTDQQKYDHFYGRAWFKNYTNKYGRFCEELNDSAKHDAYHDLECSNRKLTDLKPPEVCYYKDPLEYIEHKNI